MGVIISTGTWRVNEKTAPVTLFQVPKDYGFKFLCQVDFTTAPAKDSTVTIISGDQALSLKLGNSVTFATENFQLGAATSEASGTYRIWQL
jgi:hypothetical protein